MANGTLLVYAAVAEQAAPLPGVTVRFYDEADTLLAQRITDANGATEEVTLDAPEASYSLDVDNNTVRPYAVYRIRATIEGWQPITIQGAQVFAGQQTVARLNFLPAAQGLPMLGAPEPIVIPPHSLFGGEGGSAPAPQGGCTATERGADAQTQGGVFVLEEVVVPKKITVHLGKPSANVSNVSVNFIDYIANVASSEVYPTWVGQQVIHI